MQSNDPYAPDYDSSPEDWSDREEEKPTVHQRRFLDPVHDYMTFSPLALEIIDTPQFQRLRHLKQLGISYWVFPGASHARFEHCLGVGFLARQMVEAIRSRQPELEITDRDVLCIEIAGLCHDLGHGPFSHVFDGRFVPKVLPGSTWSHEQGSEMMFDALIEKNGIILDESSCNFVKDLIRGRPKDRNGVKNTEKRFLFQIVANGLNGIDVDKFDYIARDTLNCGVKCNLMTSRLINSCRVIRNVICYEYKEHFNIAELFHTRYSLHRTIYSHKSAKAIELMLVDALVAAQPVFKIAEKIFDPDEYLHLDDTILHDIEKDKKTSALDKSRTLIHRIRLRKLYKEIDLTVMRINGYKAWFPHVTSKAIAGAVTPKILEEAPLPEEHEDADEGLTEEDVIVDWNFLHMGMKDKNPNSFVKFYSKKEPNKFYPITRNEGSHLLPGSWQEIILRIFIRHPSPRKAFLAQAAFRDLQYSLPPLEGNTTTEQLSVNAGRVDADIDVHMTDTDIETDQAPTTNTSGRSSTPAPATSIPTTPLLPSNISLSRSFNEVHAVDPTPAGLSPGNRSTSASPHGTLSTTPKLSHNKFTTIANRMPAGREQAFRRTPSLPESLFHQRPIHRKETSASTPRGVSEAGIKRERESEENGSPERGQAKRSKA